MFLPPHNGTVESDIVQEAYDLLDIANEKFENDNFLDAITNYEKAIPVLL